MFNVRVLLQNKNKQNTNKTKRNDKTGHAKRNTPKNSKNRPIRIPNIHRLLHNARRQ